MNEGPHFSFVERMVGTLEDARGRSSPVSFVVGATWPSPRALLGGRLALSGLLSAPPWATERLAEGWLELDWLGRTLSYWLELEGDSGERLRLTGEKRLSPRRPLQSMTRMQVELRGPDNTLLARGQMRFEWKELPRFVLSWVPLVRAGHRALARRQTWVGAAAR